MTAGRLRLRCDAFGAFLYLGELTRLGLYRHASRGGVNRLGVIAVGVDHDQDTSVAIVTEQLEPLFSLGLCTFGDQRI